MNATRIFHRLFVSTLGLMLVWGELLGAAGEAHGQTSYEQLYAFEGGRSPSAGVIRDEAGNLFGRRRLGQPCGKQIQ